MDLKLKNKTALIMGSSSGLGYSIAEALLAEGVQVAICGKNPEKLERAQQKLRAPHAFQCDLNLPGSAQKLTQDAIKNLGRVDILVCNTGGPPKGNFLEVTRPQWALGFEGLWMSTVEAIQAALPGMIQSHWGRILLVTSVAAKEPLAHMTISNSLRAGLLGLTNSLSHEIASQGVTINALLPGYTRTERLKELKIPEETIVKQIPAARLAEPEEFAALATFLASEQAGYITGQAIACDGGYMRGI